MFLLFRRGSCTLEILLFLVFCRGNTFSSHTTQPTHLFGRDYNYQESSLILLINTQRHVIHSQLLWWIKEDLGIWRGVCERDSLTQHTRGTFKGVSLVGCRQKCWILWWCYCRTIFFLLFTHAWTLLCTVTWIQNQIISIKQLVFTRKVGLGLGFWSGWNSLDSHSFTVPSTLPLLLSSSEHTWFLSVSPSGSINVHSSPAVHP